MQTAMGFLVIAAGAVILLFGALIVSSPPKQEKQSTDFRFGKCTIVECGVLPNVADAEFCEFHRVPLTGKATLLPDGVLQIEGDVTWTAAMDDALVELQDACDAIPDEGVEITAVNDAGDPSTIHEIFRRHGTPRNLKEATDSEKLEYGVPSDRKCLFVDDQSLTAKEFNQISADERANDCDAVVIPRGCYLDCTSGESLEFAKGVFSPSY